MEGLNLNVMFAARLGGSVVSNTEAFLDYYGVSERSAAAREAGGVRINNGMVDAQNYYQTIGAGTGAGAYYIYDATNVRMQEPVAGLYAAQALVPSEDGNDRFSRGP